MIKTEKWYHPGMTQVDGTEKIMQFKNDNGYVLVERDSLVGLLEMAGFISDERDVILTPAELAESLADNG